MSIVFTVEPGTRIVSYTAHHLMTMSELDEFLQAVLTHPDYKKRFHFLGDVRTLQDVPDSNYMRSTVNIVASHAEELGICRWAIVATSLAVFGMVRMGSFMIDRTGINVSVFLNDFDSARGWLTDAKAFSA